MIAALVLVRPPRAREVPHPAVDRLLTEEDLCSLLHAGGLAGRARAIIGLAMDPELTDEERREIAMDDHAGQDAREALRELAEAEAGKRRGRRAGGRHRGAARAVREARPEASRYMTEAQVASLLHVDRCAVRKFRGAPIDPLPARKAGRRFLYDPKEVDSWMRRQADRSTPPRHRPARGRARA